MASTMLFILNDPHCGAERWSALRLPDAAAGTLAADRMPVC